MTKNKPAPQNADVYEIYGKTARSRGWDFMVCTSAKEAIDLIESDIDELDPVLTVAMRCVSYFVATRRHKWRT